ncbi:MAG: rod shape-determining protein MreC, partial [Patescibacteria group bacterium]
KKQHKILILLIFILGLTIAINKFNLDDFIRNTFYKISSAGQKLTWQTSGWLSDNQEDNQNLIKENLALKQEVITLKSQAAENVTLKAALGISQDRKETLVVADVLSKDFLGNYLLINKGSQDKITKDLAVITSDGALVGRIENVYHDFSQVLLITSASSSFEAEIENAGDILTVIKGTGGGTLAFELVPQEQILVKGNLVKTTALGNAFPKNILVGEVLNFEKEPSSSFQKGDIFPYFLQSNLKQVFIITGAK